MANPVYPSDVNDAEWVVLAPLIPPSNPHGRPRSWDMRRISNGVFLHLADRLRLALPAARVRRAADGVLLIFGDGAWVQIHARLRELARLHAGRDPAPSAAILATESVKTTEQRGGPPGGGPHGYEGAKKLAGRKRHLLVDPVGLALGALVRPADSQDRASAAWLLRQLQPPLPRLKLIGANSAYLGPLQTGV